jgi:hypothetical protein
MSGKNKVCLIFIILALLNCPFVGNCQDNDPGFWQVLNVEYSLNKKLSLWAESQIRSEKLVDNFYYEDLKVGFNFKATSTYGLAFGLGEFMTYSTGGNFKSPLVNREFRMWEQFNLINKIDRIRIDHRYRVEQRWTTGGYKNRLRYRLNPVIPLNTSSVKKGTLYGSIYAELFLTNAGEYVERNRFFAGLGYRFTKAFTVQSGWMRQFDYARNNTSNKSDFIQITLSLRLHQFETEPPSHTGASD